MWRSRIFWRIFGTYGVLLVAAIGLLGILVVGRVERHFLQQIEGSLRIKAILVREAVAGQSASHAAQLQSRMMALRREIATRITLLADDGRVLADSEEDPQRMENHADRPEVRQARESQFGTTTRFSRTMHQPMMYAAVRTDADHGEVAFVRVAMPLDNLRQQLSELRNVVATTAVITAVVALALAYWLARRVTLPLQELTSGAEQIAAGKYGHKVYRMGRDEIGQLAQSFNHMSERLETQFAQLAEDRQQLRMILSGMVEGVVALDAQQRVLFANERAGQLLEFPAPTSAGRKLWELVRRPNLQQVVQRALDASDPHQDEIVWSGPTYKSITVHAARLPGHPPRGVVLVLHDTTELRRLEHLRQDFVANVSHELKTPLSVIKAYVETLQAGAVDDPEHCGPFLEKIAEQADRLHALILDLLSLARIEAGEEAFEFRAVPVGPAVSACVDRHRARAVAKNLQLESLAPTADDPAAVVAWADEESLNQILDNLVDNAVKYTPAGGRIQLRWRSSGESICIEVEDNGNGIPEQDLSRIFERFYRVDKARSRELGGTGLGLSIVKHLVQSMHGTVMAASREGQGTTFTVMLPRAG